jgi:hypothetical protein
MKINHDKKFIAIVDAFEESVIYLKDFNMKSLCIQTTNL